VINNGVITRPHDALRLLSQHNGELIGEHQGEICEQKKGQLPVDARRREVIMRSHTYNSVLGFRQQMMVVTSLWSTSKTGSWGSLVEVNAPSGFPAKYCT
jgi:hypothetical protein